MAATARGRLALLILLDQFTRNIYRGTPRAFAADAWWGVAAARGRTGDPYERRLLLALLAALSRFSRLAVGLVAAMVVGGAYYLLMGTVLYRSLRRRDRRATRRAVVVITDGKNGAYATDGKDVYFCPAPASKVVDTTGAGTWRFAVSNFRASRSRLFLTSSGRSE